jgi:hypothetical protein
MTMIVEHGATVIPFTDALLRRPKDESRREQRTAPEGEPTDNVILLARFSRRARRANVRHWPGGPPEGEAA